jgi:hypothetical protein
MPKLDDLISPTYRQLNTSLHAGGSYGRYGDKWAQRVTELIREYDADTVLDYGCGQGTLVAALGGNINEYDPAIEEKSALPSPADLVVCTDVLEHIEPDRLTAVLDHLQSLTLKALFAVISTRPAKKLLADGRNAHLIIEPPSFWRRELVERFRVTDWRERDDEIAGVFTSLSG